MMTEQKQACTNPRIVIESYSRENSQKSERKKKRKREDLQHSVLNLEADTHICIPQR